MVVVMAMPSTTDAPHFLGVMRATGALRTTTHSGRPRQAQTQIGNRTGQSARAKQKGTPMKRIPLLAAVIAVVAAGVLSVALTAPASASSVAFYPIQNSATGMCLQPAGGFVDDGT